jgi:hypothetical protein
MMRKVFSALAFFSFILACSANAGQVVDAYPASRIDDKLLENAHAVVRKDIGEFDVQDKGNATYKVRRVITILDKKGNKFSNFVVRYDNLNKIRFVNASLYDKNGELVRKAKKNDIKDYAAHDGISVFSDDRLKYISFDYPYFPYTVELEYEIEKSNMMFYPDWSFVNWENVSVEHSQITINLPPEISLDYRTNNFDGTFKEQNVEGKKSYLWSMKNIKAFEEEDYGPPEHMIYPHILFAPSVFEVEGYEGEMRSWADYGKWQIEVNKGRQELPPQTIAEIKELTAKLTTNEQKIRAVYEYMQSKTRYVSIQLGIGGWQPFDATYVDENGYGDCKALSNYTLSLLKAIGIESHYAIIYGGDDPTPLSQDFVHRAFNHVILCVPNEQDTIWLECTSQTNPYGFMGDFTSDRQSLLITEDGGKLVNTPKYERDRNIQSRTAQVVLNVDGESTATITTHYQGLQYGNVDNALNVSPTEQEKWLYRRLNLSDYKILAFSYDQVKRPMPEAKETLELSLRNYGSKSGKRYFFTANLLNKRSSVSMQQGERKYDIYLDFPFVDHDTISYVLPEGYHVEYLPKSKEVTTDFGYYKTEYKVSEGKLLYIRTRAHNDGVFPKERYKEFIEYLNQIAESDNEKVVIVKET